MTFARRLYGLFDIGGESSEKKDRSNLGLHGIYQCATVAHWDFEQLRHPRAFDHSFLFKPGEHGHNITQMVSDYFDLRF